MEKVWLKNYPQGVPESLEIPVISLGEMLEGTAKKYPDNTAIIFMGKKITYKELDELTNRFANALKNLGVKKGDPVAIQLPNIPQLVIAYYGTLKLGAVAVMFNPIYSAREIEYQLRDSGARVFLILDRFWPLVKEANEKVGVDNIVVTHVKDYLKFPLNILEPLMAKRKGEYVEVEMGPGMHELKEIMSTASNQKPEVEIDPLNDLATLQYTGGTTGVSKGAMLTHYNLVSNSMQCRAWFTNAQEGKEVILCTLPFYHSYGMTVDMNNGVNLGAALLLIPNPRDMKMVLKAIDKYKPTVFPGVPTMYVAIINHPDVKSGKYDVGSIKACLSGAAPLPVEVQRQFEDLTGGKLVEGYGLSETSPVASANPLEGMRKAGSIGMPIPNTEMKVVDIENHNKELSVGEIGEIAIKGPQVMKGYWNMPDETEMVLKGEWLLTGDIGYMDEDGFFYVVDRKKDMIIAGGFNIYPRDVEEVIYTHPKVEEVAVAGIPHPVRGETVKAYVVLKEGETATPEEIIDFCRDKMAKYKVPTEVEFRKELPKTMVGKVLRRFLVEQEKAKAEKAEREN